MIVSYGVLFYFRGNAAVSDLLGKEDGAFETLGALGFLLAFIFFLLAFRQSKRVTLVDRGARAAAYYLIFAIAFFFAAGEEISWGQRIFGWELPESLESWNNKKEFNIHNLTPFSRTNADGIGFGFFRLFSIFVLAYCVLLPVFCRLSSWLRELVQQQLRLPIPPLWFGGFCLLNYAISKWMENTSLVDRVHAIEVKETNFAIFFLVLGLCFYVMDKRREDMRSSGTVSVMATSG